MCIGPLISSSAMKLISVQPEREARGLRHSVVVPEKIAGSPASDVVYQR